MVAERRCHEVKARRGRRVGSAATLGGRHDWAVSRPKTSVDSKIKSGPERKERPGNLPYLVSAASALVSHDQYSGVQFGVWLCLPQPD
eukprot:scaffold31518_cov56-Cyclotella_meneghiniana.AAC.1